MMKRLRTVTLINSSMATIAGPGALREVMMEKFLRASRVAVTCRENEKSETQVASEEALGDFSGVELSDMRRKWTLSNRGSWEAANGL